MKTPFFAVLALALAGAGSSIAGPIYNNTTTDTNNTWFYNAGGWNQIGDSITLGGVDRFATDAQVQFFNLGIEGNFSAILRFWDVGSPVAAQIGSSYILNGLSIATNDFLTVNFTGLNLFLPNSVVFTVEVSSLSNNSMGLGLNVFAGPTLGSSTSTAFITRTGTTFNAESADPGQGNLYFLLNASEIPEPSTVTMAGGAALFLFFAARKRK
jgi:hypothetical protein